MSKLLIAIAVLLSSCKGSVMEAERKYNHLAWENRMQDERIEILQKQITIDSLKRHDIFKKDTVHYPKHLDELRRNVRPYLDELP